MASKIEQEELNRAKKNSEDFSKAATGITDDTLARIQAAIDAQQQVVGQENQAAQKQTLSDYDRLMQSNALQEAISRKSMEDALLQMGYSGLNRTEDLALQARTGQADYAAQKQQEQALRILADLLNSYQAQSNAYNTETSAGLRNTMSNAMLDERNTGYQNAMASTAAQYQAQKEAEAAAEQQRLEEEKRWAKLQQDSFPVDQLKTLVNNGLTVQDAVRVMAGLPALDYQSTEETEAIKQQEELQKQREKLDKTYRTWWDKLIPWDTQHEKELKEYGKSEPGRIEALEDIIIELKDYDRNNAAIGRTLLTEITKGVANYSKPFDEVLEQYLRTVKDKWGNNFSDEEISILKRELAPQLKLVKEEYDFRKNQKR